MGKENSGVILGVQLCKHHVPSRTTVQAQHHVYTSPSMYVIESCGILKKKQAFSCRAVVSACENAARSSNPKLGPLLSRVTAWADYAITDVQSGVLPHRNLSFEGRQKPKFG